MRANLSINAHLRGCHAPLYAWHPVITPGQAEATQIRRSVTTRSSAYADDDDREYGNCRTLMPMSVRAFRPSPTPLPVKYGEREQTGSRPCQS